MKYNGFISYSHSSDSNLAPSIERALERFAKPMFKRRALNIFRDSNDLSASPDLWGDIQDGLSQSEYFIFLASTQAARSKWCRKEIEFWRANKQFDKFLIVLTDGELVWDDLKGDFNWEQTNCLPDNLSGAFKNEPLYVDFTDIPATMSLDDPAFTNKVVLLAATLHGRSVGDMIGEDVRQYRRMLRTRNAAIGVLSTLLIATIALAVFAFQKKEEALRQADRALGSSYVNASKANLIANSTLAVRLAEHGYRFAKSKNLELEEFTDQLIAAFYQNSNFYLKGSQAGIEEKQRGAEYEFYTPLPTVVETKERKLVFTNTDGLYLKSIGGDPISLVAPDDYPGYKHLWHSFSPKGRFALTLDRYDRNAGQFFDVLKIFDLLGQKLSVAESDTTFGKRFFYPVDIKFDADERRFLIFGHLTGATLYNYRTSGSSSLQLNSDAEEVLSIDLTSDGNMAALSLNNGGARVLRFDEQQAAVLDKWQLGGYAATAVHSITFSAEGQHLITKSNKATRRWNADNDALRKYVMLRDQPSYHYDASPKYETLGDKGHLSFLDDQRKFEYVDDTGRKIAEFRQSLMEKTNGDDEKASEWTSPDGRYYATRNGLFNSEDEQLIAFNETRYAYKHDRYEIGFSTDGKIFFMIDKLFFLDAEMILSMLNDSRLFGEVAMFDDEERERYSIR